MDPFVARSGSRIAVTIVLLGALAAAVLAACNGGGGGASTGGDGGVVSANQSDGGTAGSGSPDAGTPPAIPDAGTDAGTAGFTPGGPGPWPLDNRTYGAAEGLTEPAVAASTDEAQNLWVASRQAVYLMKPGDAKFTRFTSADGLHLFDNPLFYDEDYCGGEQHVRGSASPEGISTLVGGAADEVFVGYFGNPPVKGDCSDASVDRHSGQIDRLRLNSDGTLGVTRLQMVSTGMGMAFWHNRTVYRLAYDHVVHPHTLYAGTEHGVDMFFPDKWRAPNPGEWTGFSIQEWMSDHLHVQVCFHDDPVCLAGGEGNSRMGDWRGLAIAADGDLWHAGRWSAGKIRWVADLKQWNMRSGAQAYAVAYGNGSDPVFPVSQLGDVVSLSAVAVAKDGSPWFASSFFYGPVPSVPSPGSGRGLAHDTGNARFTYVSPFAAGMSQQDVQDMVALPDGRLALAGASTGLVFWDPASGAKTALRAGQGIPDDGVRQLELDTMVDPPALRVATNGGVAVLRQLPK
jgi:hypothetical protein